MKIHHIVAATLAATLAAAALPADASYRSTVRVVNNSSYTILSIKSSPTYRNSYGDTDLLGSSTVVRPGYQVSVDFDSDDAENKCVQDILVQGTNGAKWSKRMNVCNTTSWTLTD